MIEKRFIFNSDSDWWTISDNSTNDERLWGQDVVDLLNELHEEKVYYQIKSGSCEEELLKLRRDNEQLKQRLNHAEKVNTGLIDENHRLRLTIIHSSDLNFDINWLKENLKDWNNYE